MKILTFGDFEYIPHLVNCYRNLKQFNKHNDLIVFGLDEKTAIKIKTLEPDCNVRVFTSKKFNYKNYINDKLAYYCILQYIKQEIIQEYVKIYNKVFYLDSDIIHFLNIFNIIDKMLDKHDILLKFYLQDDRFNKGTLKNIVNCGTIGIKNTEINDKLFNFFFNKAFNTTPLGNLDEYHYTEFIDNINYGIIDNNINLINCENHSFSIDEIKQLSPMSFHPTYTINEFYPNRPYTKVGVAKALGKWFYE